MRKLKILFTTSNFNTAGSGKVIYDLIAGLDKTKFEIEIACGHKQGEFFKTMESLGLPIHIFQTKTSYTPYFSLFFRVKKISNFFKTHRYDIIHSWQWSNDWTEALAAKLAKAKWIYTKKAMGFESNHWKIKSYLADYIITINDDMGNYFPRKKAQKLIPLGIDTAYYSPEHFTKNSTKGQFNIITVANMVPVKGIEVLLQAVHQLNDSQIRLCILGNDTNDYGLEMKALSERLKLQAQVTFLGKTSDVRPYISKSDVYIIPTLDSGRKEGMPMALVEAMSMGIPVLGSDISGIRFVLRDFQNLLFKAGDVNVLSQRIRQIQLLTPEDRFKLGENLRAYCEEHFTLDGFVKSHEDLYYELAGDYTY